MGLLKLKKKKSMQGAFKKSILRREGHIHVFFLNKLPGALKKFIRQFTVELDISLKNPHQKYVYGPFKIRKKIHIRPLQNSMLRREHFTFSLKIIIQGHKKIITKFTIELKISFKNPNQNYVYGPFKIREKIHARRL